MRAGFSSPVTFSCLGASLPRCSSAAPSSPCLASPEPGDRSICSSADGSESCLAGAVVSAGGVGGGVAGKIGRKGEGGSGGGEMEIWNFTSDSALSKADTIGPAISRRLFSSAASVGLVGLRIGPSWDCGRGRVQKSVSLGTRSVWCWIEGFPPVVLWLWRLGTILSRSTVSRRISRLVSSISDRVE